MTPENYECRKCHQGMYVPDGMDPLDEDVRFCESCAIDEIERLQEIIGHLPKTADGVLIVPGISVWLKTGKNVTVDSVEVMLDTIGWRDITGRPYLGSECYSTSEAAEAARKGPVCVK